MDIAKEKVKDGCYRGKDVSIFGRKFSHNYVVIRNNVLIGSINRELEGYRATACVAHSVSSISGIPGIKSGYLNSVEMASNWINRVAD